MSKKKLIINTDGGARGNPGPAGIGVVIKDDTGTLVYSYGGHIGDATNNIAEYRALIKALQEAGHLGATEVVIRMDSELIVKQMRGEYKIKEPTLRLLAQEALQLLKHFNSHSFAHVRREYNQEADALVNQALDELL